MGWLTNQKVAAHGFGAWDEYRAQQAAGKSDKQAAQAAVAKAKADKAKGR